MTRRPDLDDRDPLPEQPWEPTSSEWARRAAREALAEAIRRNRENRTAPYGPTP